MRGGRPDGRWLSRGRSTQEVAHMTVGAAGPKTVLVVEDDPWTRTITTALLAGEGFAVVEAKNGEEGLRLAEQHSPDVVLLDLALPTKSGLEVLRELKADDQTSQIPVIVVSAYGALMNAADAHQATGIVQKPFDYDELVSQVERATSSNLQVATL
jgi:CheY-like chemotaxis protein